MNTKENIDEIFEEVPETYRAQEVLGEFISHEQALIQVQDIRVWDEPLPQPLQRVIGVDLAISEKGHYTAIVELR